MSHIDDELVKRTHRDLQDDFDEELELELEGRDHGVMPAMRRSWITATRCGRTSSC